MKYRFEFRRYALPFRAPVRTAHGAWTTREGVWVRLTREDGRIGYGEAAPISWFGTETVDEIAERCAEIGAFADDERIDTFTAAAGVLRGALTMARRAMEAPLEAAVDYLPVAALLPAGRAALAEVDAKIDAGFRNFKWKVGVGDGADELALLDDLLGRFPSGAKLRLDANGAWEPRVAERWFERCAERPIEWIEQPLAPDRREARDWLLGLANDYPTPVGLDESVSSDRDVDHWLEVGWPGVFVIKPSLLADAGAVIARLRARQARVAFSSALETAIGAQAALRLALHHGGKCAVGFGVWPLFEDRHFDGPTTAPFVRKEDIDRIDAEAVWNALS